MKRNSSLAKICTVLALLTFLGGTQPSANAANKYTLRLGTIFLDRDSNDPAPLIRRSVSPDVGAQNLDLDMGAGWELFTAVQTNDHSAFSVRFFDIQNLDDSARLSDPSGLGFDVIPAGIGVFGALVNSDLSYELDLTSAEMMVHHGIRRNVDWLFGFRYFEHDEDLRGYFTAPSFPGSTNTVDFSADNDLAGLQTGLDVTLISRRRFRLEVLGKAAAMHNSISTGYSARGAGLLSSLDESTTATESEFAFLGELQVSGLLRLYRSLNLRVAYNLIGLSDIATASDQVARTNRSTGTMDAIVDSDPIYHGVSFGLELTH